MEVLRQQFLRIQQQVGSLTLSQKMLAVTLVMVMALTVMYWGRYAATPESVAFLDQAYPPEQAVRVVSELERQGIRATVGPDGRVMVPADRQMNALAAVAYSRMLPSNSSAAVDKIVGQMTVFDSNQKTDRLWNEKKAVLLAQTIGRFPGVEEAVVHIDPAERRSFSAPSQPTASINIRMTDGQRPGKQLIMAAADTVVGAQSGLTRSNVMVIVDGVSHPILDRDADLGAIGGEILEQKQGWERFFVGKIRDVLGHVRNPMITVSVDLNTKRIDETRSEVDPKNVIQKETNTTEKREETTNPPPPAPEPGAQPNTGVMASAAPVSSGGSTTEESTTSFQVAYGQSTKTIKTPPGDAVVTTASVRVPRSYFVAVWKQLNPKAQDVDEAGLNQLMATELEKLRKDVLSATGLRDPQAVTVDYYVEAAPEPLEAGSGGHGIPMINAVGGFGKEIALGALALTALLMVSGIVKKGAQGVPATIATEITEQRRELEKLNGGEEIVGAAAEGTGALEALELDEETSQTQQMINQVSSMVKENPDAATSLVKRWLNRT